MKALVVGLGMGNLYVQELKKLNYNVDTVDLDKSKGAVFSSVDEVNSDYEIAVVCTPNFTHEPIARQIAQRCKIVLIEKPGVKDSKSWASLVSDFPNTRFMMIKNNQYRKEIKQFKQQADQSDTVFVRWNNANRIPSPGSWFTTKSKSFGGVSRDLMPHMLSYYCTLTDFNAGIKIKAVARQNNKLEDIESTEYGIIDRNGTFDVDDFCCLEFQNGNTTWVLSADWKTNLDHNDSSIAFGMKNSAIRHELGLCPEEAYSNMMKTAVENLNKDAFWKEQFTQDIWIHEQIENL
jgi:predicted dehydrogenase